MGTAGLMPLSRASRLLLTSLRPDMTVRLVGRVIDGVPRCPSRSDKATAADRCQELDAPLRSGTEHEEDISSLSFCNSRQHKD